MNMLFYLILKLLQLLFKLLKIYIPFCSKLYAVFKANSKWWVVLTMTL